MPVFLINFLPMLLPMPLPVSPAVLAPLRGSLLGELAAFGLAIGFSPLHIGLLLLVLLGPNPLRRGGLFVAGWLITGGLIVTALLTVGHGLVLTMEQGTSHRTGLDLLAAGGLLAIAMQELFKREQEGEQPGWTRRLDQFCALPLPLLLAVSTGLQLAAPDDLFLFAKAAGSVLAAGLFVLATGLLLLLPLGALLLLGSGRVLPLLEAGKSWLFRQGDLLLGLLSLALAIYLGWQGIEGLRLS
jgi:hypothetical protein